KALYTNDPRMFVFSCSNKNPQKAFGLQTRKLAHQLRKVEAPPNHQDKRCHSAYILSTSCSYFRRPRIRPAGGGTTFDPCDANCSVKRCERGPLLDQAGHLAEQF